MIEPPGEDCEDDGVVEVFTCRSGSPFSLPRGVVPLDLVELFGRCTVVVGTIEHGVFLCGVCPVSGALAHIARHLSDGGLGPSVFPPLFAQDAAVCPAGQKSLIPW